MSRSTTHSRATFLGAALALPALAAALSGTARADSSKSPQATMQYQSTPKDGKHCSGCTFFIPGESATANGSCKVVDGTISPNGWCIAYNALHS